MNVKNEDKEHFEILRKIANKPEVSQRVMANELGFSLGKLNYCLAALKSKGLIKIKKFKENKKKITYLYVLTPNGIVAKTKITINFMKKMMNEYDELKSEIKKTKVKKKLDKDLL
tara:strand:+ start:1539 stop:1883 length:345 start_codon:yes stop_codon:yes gene_type:complete